MTDAEKLLHLFHSAYDLLDSKLTSKVIYNKDGDPIGINIMHNDKIRWSVTREDLIFDFVTKNF